jgi:uncharacterized protein YndB with AHSA1/START domain
MKKTWLCVLMMICLKVADAQVKNTSYVTSTGEKVLRLEAIVPTDLKSAWQLFTTDEGLKKWIAPVAHIEYSVGGSIVTNYDKNKQLSDPSSIRLPILSYLENQLLIFKVNLNDNFPESCRNSDKNLQEVVQFKEVGPGQTQIISSMIGWGTGPDWDKTYTFFEKGNTWTYQELLKVFGAK